MIKYPKFKKGDTVKFNWKDGTKIGKVYIVDRYGTFGQDKEISYDIMVEEDDCLYKHVPESEIE